MMSYWSIKMASPAVLSTACMRQSNSARRLEWLLFCVLASAQPDDRTVLRGINSGGICVVWYVVKLFVQLISYITLDVCKTCVFLNNMTKNDSRSRINNSNFWKSHVTAALKNTKHIHPCGLRTKSLFINRFLKNSHFFMHFSLRLYIL